MLDISAVADVFKPQSDTKFKLVDTDLIQDRHTLVYEYEVSRELSQLTLRAGDAEPVSVSDGAAHDLVIQSLDARVVPVTRIPDVLREWREPRHSEFREGRTAWRLFNAFTESLKGRLDALPTRTQALHGLLDCVCGLATSCN